MTLKVQDHAETIDSCPKCPVLLDGEKLRLECTDWAFDDYSPYTVSKELLSDYKGQQEFQETLVLRGMIKVDSILTGIDTEY